MLIVVPSPATEDNDFVDRRDFDLFNLVLHIELWNLYKASKSTDSKEVNGKNLFFVMPYVSLSIEFKPRLLSIAFYRMAHYWHSTSVHGILSAVIIISLKFRFPFSSFNICFRYTCSKNMKGTEDFDESKSFLKNVTSTYWSMDAVCRSKLGTFWSSVTKQGFWRRSDQ